MALASNVFSAVGAILPILVPYLLVWGFICVAWWALKLERFGVTGPPWYLIWRTARLNELIRRIADWKPTLWRTIWNLGVVTGVGSMVFIFYKLAANLMNLSVGSSQAVSVQPIIPVPGVFVTFQTFPFLVLALSICLISHELSHGIASLAERVPLKSTGAFFAHVILGGFVEPDEEKLNQAKPATKLRVFAAGSYTNLILGVIVILLLANFTATITPFYTITPSGITVTSISPSLPAHNSGLQAGDTITAINGTTVANINDLRRIMADVHPGQVVNLQTQRGTFSVRTAADPTNSSHALIGINLSESINYVPKFSFLPSDLPDSLSRAEYWAYVVLTSVAVINMLPMFPFDGDKFLETALNMLGVREAKQIRTVANGAAYAILLMNVLLSFLRFGFMRL